MLDFSLYTMDFLLERQLNRVTNKIDKRSNSLIAVSLRPESYELAAFYEELDKVQRNGWYQTAGGTFLDYLADMRGLTRRNAVAAVREGEFDQPLSIGDIFKTINGANSINFTVTSELGLQPDGYYHYELTAQTPGVEGNSYTGNLLPVTYVQGLTYAALTNIITPGSDQESDDELRVRYELSLIEQPFGGNIASYRSYLLERDDIGAIQVYPVAYGPGTVLISILDANFDPATAALVEAIQYYICPPVAPDNTPTANGLGMAPIDAQVTITSGTPFDVAVLADIELAPGYTRETVQENIETAIKDYLLSVRKEWGKPLTTMIVEYPLYIYISKIIVAILSVEGVANVSGILLNDEGTDIYLEESVNIQEVPYLSELILNV